MNKYFKKIVKELLKRKTTILVNESWYTSYIFFELNDNIYYLEDSRFWIKLSSEHKPCKNFGTWSSILYEVTSEEVIKNLDNLPKNYFIDDYRKSEKPIFYKNLEEFKSKNWTQLIELNEKNFNILIK